MVHKKKTVIFRKFIQTLNGQMNKKKREIKQTLLYTLLAFKTNTMNIILLFKNILKRKMHWCSFGELIIVY